MKQSWIIGMLALINFLVGTSQFIIVGILDKIAASMGITIEMAGQLVTAFALASAFGSPPFVILVSRPQKNEQLTAALVTLLVGIFILVDDVISGYLGNWLRCIYRYILRYCSIPGR